MEDDFATCCDGQLVLRRPQFRLSNETLKCRPNLVSVSVFRFEHGYRDTSNYAQGLVTLAGLVQSHLKSFRLRVYCDYSLDPRVIESSDASNKLKTAWSECFERLMESGITEFVWFECPKLLASTGFLSHQDLFGTLMRFIPMFHISDLPSWCGNVGTGSLVFVSDADFKNYITEHMMVHLIRWYEQQSNDCKDHHVPELIAMSTTGSAAARHQPSFHLPPFIANCIATRIQYPGSWFTTFLSDLLDGPNSVLAKRYAIAVHAQEKKNYTYDRRNMIHQRSFPFGIDEFFLTTILKSKTMARLDHTQRWQFFIVPNVDTILHKAITLLSDMAQQQGRINIRNKSIRKLVTALAKCAESVETELCHDTSDTITSTDIARIRSKWPRAAAGRVAFWKRYNGESFDLNTSQSNQLATDVLQMLEALVNAMTDGCLIHTSEDLDHIVQMLQIASCISPSLIGSLTYSIGGGQVTPLQRTSLDQSLLSSMYSEMLTCPANSDTSTNIRHITTTSMDALLLPSNVLSVADKYRRDPSCISGPVYSLLPTNNRKRGRDMEEGDTQTSNKNSSNTWVTKYSRSTGQTYYYNPTTNESRWEKPV